MVVGGGGGDGVNEWPGQKGRTASGSRLSLPIAARLSRARRMEARAVATGPLVDEGM